MSPTSKTKTTAQKSSAEEFIKTEYEQLNQWAMHGQSTTNQIFNFYVSFLTASLGGLVVIFQVSRISFSTAMFIVSGVAFLLVIVGIVFLDALITQYIRNAYYHAGIISIQNFYKQFSIVEKTIQQHPPFSIEADAEEPDNFIGKYMPFIKYLLPVGIQQIFMSLITSLLLGLTIIGIVTAINGIGTDLSRLLIAAGISAFLAFSLQNVFARAGLQEELDRIKELNAASVRITAKDNR